MRDSDTIILSEKEYTKIRETVSELESFQFWIQGFSFAVTLKFNNQKILNFCFEVFGDDFQVVESFERQYNSKTLLDEELNSFLLEYDLKKNELTSFIRQIKKSLGHEIQTIELD